MSNPEFRSQTPKPAIESTPVTPIDKKLVETSAAHLLGNPLHPAQMFPDGVSYLQEFQNAVIVFTPAYGAVSLAMSIYEKWNSPSVANSKTATGDIIRDYLGFPVADSFNTGERGGVAAYFERGMIVVRANQQAYVTYGAIYGHYRTLGDISDSNGMPVVGLPISDEEAASKGGRRSRFDGGDIYWTGGTGAWEVHGAIRDRWLAMGGADSVLGYPTTDENGVMNGQTQIGRFNRFANGGTIYWSQASGAWDVYGAIYDEWHKNGGPTGPLGFPVSGETDTPSLPPPFATSHGRFNDFQNGVIVWYPDGDYAGATTVTDLRLYLERYDCNDSFNVQINITATPSNPPNVNHGRMPSGGNYDGGGKELDTVMLTIPKAQSNTEVNIWMLCIHENTIGTDDEKGTVTAAYNILNLWGLREANHSHVNGAFTATFAMQPITQIVSPDPMQFRTQLFWPFRNFTTADLSWKPYSETFSDVAETDKHINLNPFEFKLHLFEIAFYAMAYHSMAQDGNCFGMCLESVFARDHRSLFIEPLFTSNAYHKNGMLLASDGTQLKDSANQTPSAQDAEVSDEINIKHGYQLGINLIEWFLGKWTAGALHDPIRAFKESRDAFNRHDWPILTISDQSEFSQQYGHVLVPYHWDDTDPYKWRILVANPNYPPPTGNEDIHNEIVIDLQSQSFSFQFGDGAPWTGSINSGGRLLTIPYSQLNSEPVTPGDAIFALLLGAVIIICGGDGQSQQITDEAGRTFYKNNTVLENRVIPSHLAGRLTPGRQINEDPKTRIPDMALIPLHGVHPPSGAIGNIGNIGNIGSAIQKSPPEMYYARRPAPLMKMEPLSSKSLTEAHIAGAAASTAPASPTKAPTIHTSAAVSAEAAHAALVNPSAAAASTGGMPTVRSHSSTVNNENIGILNMIQPSLSFEVGGQAAGNYEWAVLAPRMSVSVSAPCSAGLTDTIRLDSMNGADQSVSVTIPANGKAKPVNVAVGGWAGADPRERKWYELVNLNMTPGQTITAQMNNGGRELLVQNNGPALTFELRVHFGMDPHAVAVRSAVPLDADKAFHFAPVEWNAQSMAQTPLKMTVLENVGGAQVREVQL